MTSLKKPKYCKRKWLSSDTHSSAYIHCYYNTGCRNPEYQSFIRIADCYKSFTLNTNDLSKSDLQRFLIRLKDLCELKIRHFRFKEYVFRVHEDVNFCWLTIGKVCDHKVVNIVTLHQDVETCTKSQWRIKLNTIKEEIGIFTQFLLTVDAI